MGDQALLRLAQEAGARGDLEQPRGHLETLLTKHPGSPHRLEARVRPARSGPTERTTNPPRA